MARKMSLACCAALLLSACSSYPRLVSIAPLQTGDVNSALTEGSRLQTEYSTGYMDSAQVRDFSQLPIIGAAAVAAWVLLNARAGTARRVGRIGILAGSYSEARGQLFTANLTEIYIAGHTALTCVLVQGAYFTGTTAEARLAEMTTKLSALNQSIVATTSLIAAQPSGGSDAELALLRTTRAAAEQAIALARAAASTAWSERMAYQGAGPTFWAAVSSISARVASRGAQRPGVEYQKLVAEFTPGAPRPESLGTRTAGQITEELIKQIGMLVGATGELRGATPNYNERLEQVAACPARAG